MCSLFLDNIYGEGLGLQSHVEDVSIGRDAGFLGNNLLGHVEGVVSIEVIAVEQNLTSRGDAVKAIEAYGERLVGIAGVGYFDDVFACALVNRWCWLL